MSENTTQLKKLDGSTETVAVKPTKAERRQQQIVSRPTVQRVRLPDGTIQEIKVIERRTKRADDRMQRRKRAKKNGKLSSALISDQVRTPMPAKPAAKPEK